MSKRLIFWMLSLMTVIPLSAKTLAELPVSAAANTLYLNSLADRPWWNRAWTRRAPILVSSTTGEYAPKTVVDVIVDFGEKINPDEVRIVTPWETSVDSVAERVGTDSKIRLLFMTDLRPNENKPFLVYWGNPAAKRPRVRTTLTLDADEDEVRIMNGLVEVVFDNRHKTPGFLKRLRAVGAAARNELMNRATGYAWEGFTFNPGGNGRWSKAEVVADNAFKKEIKFVGERGSLSFAIYAEQPRVDWHYELKPGVRSARSSISFGVGGGASHDDIFYVGTVGKVLSVEAGNDEVSDNLPFPSYDFAPWISEGWVAVRDRKAKDIAGVIFPREATDKLGYWGHAFAAGEKFSFQYAHRGDAKRPMTGSGALVAMTGDAEDFRREYRRLKDPPRVFMGEPEQVREIAARIPQLDRDFCPDFNIGPGAGAGWASGEPLEGTDWAENTVDHLLAKGARVLHFCGVERYALQLLDIDRASYDGWQKRLRGIAEPNVPFEKVNTYGAKLKEVLAAVHAKGMAMNSWGAFLPGFKELGGANMFRGDLKLNETAVAVDTEIQDRIVEAGVDAYCPGLTLAEGPIMRKALKQKNGRDFCIWKDPEPFFADIDWTNGKVAEFYRHAKAKHPDKPVILWNSENSELRREMFMSEQAGSFDSCMVEILPGAGDFQHVKHVVKRMRALFNNEAGRTVYHHFYFFHLDFMQRVWEAEMPFIAGVNGFSYENVTYENVNPEYLELIADFYRFAGHTRLGDKAARMTPVKNLAVFRDHAAFRDDVRRKTTGKPYPYRAQQDGRVRAFGRIPNYSWDVVVNRYFTAKDLAPYKAVYIPEDRVLSDGLVRELLAYVKNGGGAIVEGVTGEKVAKAGGRETWRDAFSRGELAECGKGKIVWTRKILTDLIAYDNTNAIAVVKKLVADVGGVEPYVLEGSKALDSVLQEGGGGMLLGVVNKADAVSTGNVILRRPHAGVLFVLDVKNGTRHALTNNAFTVTVGPKNAGYYLIGDDAFTALPTAREGVVVGARVAASDGKAFPLTPRQDDGFVPYKGVELWGSKNGLRPSSRAKFAMIDTRVFITNGKNRNYDAERFNAAIAEAKYLIVNVSPDESDVVFRECGEALKAMLKRGGGICFNAVTTGPAARAFLKDVGVYDPNETAKSGVGDGHGKVFEPAKGSPILAPARREMGWFNHKRDYRRVFTKWDAVKQVAPVRASLDESAAMIVTQDKVLGAGKVVFNENYSVFTDWYENTNWSENILSWFMDLHVQDHREKVKHYNGGPGTVVGEDAKL